MADVSGSVACLTCADYGRIITSRTEVPFEEVSARRQKAFLMDAKPLPWRFTFDPCPHCDGQDRTPSEPPGFPT